MGFKLILLRLSWLAVPTLILGLVRTSCGLKQEVGRIPAASSPFPDLYEASIADLQDGLQKGLFTSVDLVKVWSDTCIHADYHSRYALLGLLCANRGSEPLRTRPARGHRNEPKYARTSCRAGT